MRRLASPGATAGSLLLLALLLSSVGWTREPARLLVDLNGLRLWQFKAAVRKSLGAPDQVVPLDGSSVEVYRLGKQAYAALKYLDSSPHNVYSIQVTGTSLRGMTPFQGLVLGDPQSKVVQALGRPTSIERVQDPQAPGTVQAYAYPGNYSVEILEGKTLYSIRVQASRDLLGGPTAGNPWDEFRAAVLRKDAAAVLRHLRPDVEIYRGGATHVIDRAYSAFQKRPDPAFLQAFLGESNGVRSVLQRARPQSSVRIHAIVGVGRVFKFPTGEAIEEIVFFPYAGRLRVYEVRFRR